MLAKVGKVRGSAQRVADAVVTLNARRPPGVEKELRRGWDNYLSRWALSAGAVIALVTFGNLWWSIWVGIIAATLLVAFPSAFFPQDRHYSSFTRHRPLLGNGLPNTISRNFRADAANGDVSWFVMSR